MVDRKPRGELSELSATLQGLCVSGKRSEKDLRSAKKDAFKKVINYMTLGMDMSSLFPMMISCANLSPDDVVLKKMLYLYITHYAQQTPDLALLTINQLHKDCVDQDPTVRGLALRSLCSLRVANFLEYVMQPINTGLEDRHPYVRRTAVLGVLKVQHIDPAVVANQGLLEKVRQLLYSDPDTQVISNCLVVTMNVGDLAQLAADKALVYNLINRLKEFSDWSQCQVLELVAHYHPSSEGEVYDIMNALEDRLSHVNSAVVMTAVKVFLHLTLTMPATHQQVLERIKDPLKTLISRDEPATVYAVLAHVLLIVQRAPIIFEGDHVSFYCRTHDPWYVKKLKMEILTAIASSGNVYEVVSELTEYARDINPAMAREAVKSISRIALAISDVNGIIERLLNFLDSGSEHITAEALIQLKDLLRRYPDLAGVCLEQLSALRPAAVSEPEARAALVWILGQFGGDVRPAPYLLEPLAEAFATEPPQVQLALLAAAAKLFFRRPPEAQKLLGAVLAAGLADTNQDVHDRALLYYRLLRHDAKAAERVVCQPLEAMSHFSEDATAEAQEAVFSEFNTLSVVYQRPAKTFVEATAYHSAGGGDSEQQQAVGGAAAGAAAAALVDADTSTNLLADVDQSEADLLDLDQPAAAAAAAAAPAGGAAAIDSLLDFDIGLHSAPAPAAAPQPPPQQLLLSPQCKLQPASFQEHWRSLAPAQQHMEALSPATVAALAAGNHKEFCSHMQQANIMTMASGGQPPVYRYYFYAAPEGSQGLFLVEMIVQTSSGQASITLKSSCPQLLPQFMEIWSMCLMGFYR